MSRVLKHSGHIVRFGYQPNHEHAGELRLRTAAHEMALRMLAAQPDDNLDRYNYRMLVACLQASKLSQWIVQDGNVTRLNCYDQGQSQACTGHGRSMQIAHEDAANIVLAGQPAIFEAMPAPEVQYPLGLKGRWHAGQRQRLLGQRHCRGVRAVRDVVRIGRRRLRRYAERRATGRGRLPPPPGTLALKPMRRTACPPPSPRPRPVTRARAMRT